MRAFVAVALPEAVRVALASLRDRLADSGADVKWVGTEQLHITLKFLADITPEQQAAVEALLRDLARHHLPFSMGLQEVGAFPSLVVPRVVWVGVGDGRADLIRLAEAVESGVRGLGWPAEERPFSAHVTLGRVRSPKRLGALAETLRRTTWTPPPSWRAEVIRLYQSVLSPAGPTYAVLAEIPLRGER